MTSDVDRFYELVGILATLPGQGRRLGEYTGRSAWPDRGVYFFRDPGQQRTGHPEMSRVVRVGTHAVSANATSKLWPRLRAHRGGKDGRGNHRGSVFRLHVGLALLQRDGGAAAVPKWGIGRSAARDVRNAEVPHERLVSEYIVGLSILWLAVPDDPGPRSARAYVEQNSIALLSNELSPMDRPNSEWLGVHSSKNEIRMSGLWNVKHVARQYDTRFLDRFEELIRKMPGSPIPYR